MSDTASVRDGVVRRAIFCDESGISGDHDFYGFGAVIMAYQRRGQFSADVARSGIAKPMGVAEYQLVRALPELLDTKLPSVEQLEEELGVTLSEEDDV